MTTVPPTSDPYGVPPEHLRTMRAARYLASLQFVVSAVDIAIAHLREGRPERALDTLRLARAGAEPALNSMPVNDCQRDFIAEGK